MKVHRETVIINKWLRQQYQISFTCFVPLGALKTRVLQEKQENFGQKWQWWLTAGNLPQRVSNLEVVSSAKLQTLNIYILK